MNDYQSPKNSRENQHFLLVSRGGGVSRETNNVSFFLMLIIIHGPLDVSQLNSSFNLDLYNNAVTSYQLWEYCQMIPVSSLEPQVVKQSVKVVMLTLILPSLRNQEVGGTWLAVTYSTQPWAGRD